MRILVLHQNFPGQFRTLIQAWAARPGWEVKALGRDSAPGLPGFAGFARYALARKGRSGQHPYLRQMEAATLHGQAVARAMLELRDRGFVPDAILAHPGWGESLFAKDVFPDARLVHFCEWYYHAEGADLGFDPEFPLTFDDRARIRTWNALHALNLTQCDAAVTPTEWQRGRHPQIFLPKIAVQHEGIALDELGPDPKAMLQLEAVGIDDRELLLEPDREVLGGLKGPAGALHVKARLVGHRGGSRRGRSRARTAGRPPGSRCGP
jgi:hypothetical protein